MENIRVALSAIRSQKLRTALTVLIIAVGISALVGILTATDSIRSAINSEFTMMGANTFSLRNRDTSIRAGKAGKKPKVYRPITYREAQQFTEEFLYPAQVSISTQVSWAATIKHGSNKTNPNCMVIGTDQQYLATAGYELAAGRNITNREVEDNAHVVLIGAEVAETLFPIGSPLGQSVLIGSGKYRVVGVLAEKGNGLGFGGDRTTVIPISSARQYYAGSSPTYMISILTSGPQHMDPAIGEAAGLFRIIRGDRLEAEHSFGISRSDNLTAIMIDNLAYVQIAAVIIAIITLLGAAIGLLNIMLVSVTERTKEIGTRMAVGAKQLTIRHQFLVEAVVICQIGALVGILFGMVMGNLVSFMVGSSFVVPWTWMMLGISLCIGVGLMAGYYPAKKASQLDPIDALRYE